MTQESPKENMPEGRSCWFLIVIKTNATEPQLQDQKDIIKIGQSNTVR